MRKKHLVILILTFFCVMLMIAITSSVDESFKYDYQCISYTLGGHETREVLVTLKGNIRTEFSEDIFNRINYRSFDNVIRMINNGIIKEVIEYTIKIDEEIYPSTKAGEVIVPFNSGNIYDGSGKLRIENTGNITSELSRRNNCLFIDMSYSIHNELSLDKGKRESIGGLYVADDFSDILIILSVSDESGFNWSTEDGNNVIVSTKSISEAEDLALRLNNMSLGSE